MKLIHPKSLVLFIALSISLSACHVFKTALFDQYTYRQTISLKVESVSLMKKATAPYSKHSEEAQLLFKEMKKMIEYEKNKKDNNITYKMWETLHDEHKNLFGGFVKRWETQETLSAVFIQEATKQVEEAFDLLIRYETKKNKAHKTNILNYLN